MDWVAELSGRFGREEGLLPPPKRTQIRPREGGRETERGGGGNFVGTPPPTSSDLLLQEEEKERERERERRNGESGWRRRDLLRQPSTSHRNAPVYNKYTKVNISFFYQESTWMYYCFQAERETEAHRWANSELRNRNGVFGRGREFEAAAAATFPPPRFPPNSFDPPLSTSGTKNPGKRLLQRSPLARSRRLFAREEEEEASGGGRLLTFRREGGK